MNAERQLAPQAQHSGQVVTADATSLMDVISRAASDPNTDVDKLERLMGLYERITAHKALTDYDAAMSTAQEEMRPIAADANNPQTRSKYASYAALDRALRPIYTKHGFSLSFYQGDGAPADHVRIACRVARAGHTERPHLDMPSDGKGAKGGDVMTKTHATGAAITYGKRYLLGMIFNIAVGEDLDGNAPEDRGGSPKVQAAISVINGLNTIDEMRKWKTDNLAGLDLLPKGEMNAIVAHFNARFNRMKEAAK